MLCHSIDTTIRCTADVFLCAMHNDEASFIFLLFFIFTLSFVAIVRATVHVVVGSWAGILREREKKSKEGLSDVQHQNNKTVQKFVPVIDSAIASIAKALNL